MTSSVIGRYGCDNK